MCSDVGATEEKTQSRNGRYGRSKIVKARLPGANGEVKVNTRTFEDLTWKRAPTILCKEDIGG